MIRPPTLLGIIILLAGLACGGQGRSEVSRTGSISGMEIRSGGMEKGNLPKGESVYLRVCARCHDKGISGAPKLGDRETWKVLVGGGIDNMIRNSIEGYQGNKGVMPPRGGDRTLSDAEVEAAVRYMIKQSR